MPQYGNFSASAAAASQDAAGPSRKPYEPDYRLTAPPIDWTDLMPSHGHQGNKTMRDKSYAQVARGGATIENIDDEPAAPTVRFAAMPDVMKAPRTWSTSSQSAALASTLKSAPVPDLKVHTATEDAPSTIFVSGFAQSAAAPPPAPNQPSGRVGGGGSGGGNAHVTAFMHSHCRGNGYMAVVIGIFAGGLMAAAMVGAGLLTAPASGLMITLVAGLGLFAGYIAFDIAGIRI